MNCQQAERLIEDAIDRRLSGGMKRRFDLHMARCAACRSRLAAEQREHARWFRALNDCPGAHEKLPSDFADRIAKAVAEQASRRSFFGRLPRWVRVAAVLAVMAAFSAFGSWIMETAVNSVRELSEETLRAESLGSVGSRDVSVLTEEENKGVYRQGEDAKMKMKTNVKLSPSALVASAALTVGSALAVPTVTLANTLVWWRFGEVPDGTAFGTKTIVNAANPGVCDARGYCVSSSSWEGDVSSVYAPHATGAFPTGVKLLDPITGNLHDNYLGMTLNGHSSGSVTTSGAVKGSDPSVFQRQTFTAEVFVRMTSAKAKMISDDSNRYKAPYPIFSVTKGVGDEIWGLLYYHNKLLCRTVIGSYEMLTSDSLLNDGKWHHVALTADGSCGSSVVLKMYLDYSLVAERNYQGQFDYAGAADFNLGVNPFASTRKFPGDIDEFRFSDAVLDPQQFLRFADEAGGYGVPQSSDSVFWDGMGAQSSDYWFGSTSLLRCGRLYYEPGSTWTRVNYAFGGAAGMGAGAHVADVVQSEIWSQIGGSPVANQSSFRTINKETVTQADQQQGGYVIVTPPAGSAVLTDGDFTLEYYYKSNGGNKLGTTATLLMYPTDANGGSYKTPDPVIQHFFTSGGTGYIKFKNVISEGQAADVQYVLPVGLDSCWHRVAIVYEKTARRIVVYVDRKKALTCESVLLPSTSQGIVLGARGTMWNSNNSFDGWIDEVRITKRALRLNELMQLSESCPGMSIIVR